MIDGDRLQKVIDKGYDFRLGTRGICVNCYRRKTVGDWCILIPRAFTEIHADDLKVVDDEYFYSLEVYRGGEMIADINLSAYDTLTLPYVRTEVEP